MVSGTREVPLGVGTPGHLEDLLGGQLVHGKRTAKGIRACVADPQDIKGGLQFAVLPYRAVEPMKVISAMRHSWITLGPR